MNTVQKEIFDFPIQRVPMYATVGDEQIKTDKDAIIRLDTMRQVGTVSAISQVTEDVDGNEVVKKMKYYKEITHTELVTEARTAISALGLAAKETTFLFNNGARMYHEFDFGNTGIEPSKGDFVTMKLTLTNSYDLSLQCGWELGGKRLVCSNGLIAFVKAFFEMKKHTGAFNMDITVENLKKAVDTFQTKVAAFYTTMAETPVTQEAGKGIITDMVERKILPEKYGTLVHTMWEHPEKGNEIIPALGADGKIVQGDYQTVLASTQYDTARNLWVLYNAFTLILSHYVMALERRRLIHVNIQNHLKTLMRKEFLG